MSTPAVTLEPFRASEHLEVAVRLVSDDRVAYHMDWDACRTREEAMLLLNYDILLHPWCRVGRVEGLGPVGLIYARFFRGAEACRAEIYAAMVPEHWGRGVGTAGLKAGVAELFGGWPQLERIEAVVHEGHAASEAVLRKAGFRREAVLEKHTLKAGKAVSNVIYSILRPLHSKL